MSEFVSGTNSRGATDSAIADENARLFGVGGWGRVARGAGAQWARGAEKVLPRERRSALPCAPADPGGAWGVSCLISHSESVDRSS